MVYYIFGFAGDTGTSSVQRGRLAGAPHKPGGDTFDKGSPPSRKVVLGRGSGCNIRWRGWYVGYCQRWGTRLLVLVITVHRCMLLRDLMGSHVVRLHNLRRWCYDNCCADMLVCYTAPGAVQLVEFLAQQTRRQEVEEEAVHH